MSNTLEPELFVTLLGNGSFSLYDLETVEWLALSDAFVHTSPVTMYAYAVLSLVALVVILPAFAWHVRAGNLPATCIVVWTGWLNAAGLANTLIWPTDDVGSWWAGYGYCDISAKLTIAGDVGLVGAALCILRSLAAALDVDHMTAFTLPQERRRRKQLEAVLCLGLPLLHALSHLLVQDARFAVFAMAGCSPTWARSWPSVVLVGLPPVVLALAAAGYALLVLVRVTRYRRDFAEVLCASSAGISVARFFRLYALAALLVLVYLPFKLDDLYNDAAAFPLQPFDWAAVHDPHAWASIRFYPTAGNLLPYCWSYVALAAGVVLTVGLGSDAHAFYRDSLVILGFDSVFPSLRPVDGAAQPASALGSAPRSPATAMPPDSAASDRSSGSLRKWWGALASPAATAHFALAGGLAGRTSAATVCPPPPPYDLPREMQRVAEDRSWRAIEERLGLR